jgi:hypothetical protein
MYHAGRIRESLSVAGRSVPECPYNAGSGDLRRADRPDIRDRIADAEVQRRMT